MHAWACFAASFLFMFCIGPLPILHLRWLIQRCCNLRPSLHQVLPIHITSTLIPTQNNVSLSVQSQEHTPLLRANLSDMSTMFDVSEQPYRQTAPGRVGPPPAAWIPVRFSDDNILDAVVPPSASQSSLLSAQAHSSFERSSEVGSPAMTLCL